jgi:transposase
MARRTTLTFSTADLDALGTQRYEHPDPRVQQRMEVLWLISQGETQARCGQLAGVSKATVARYIAIFRQHGVAGLRVFQWVKPVGALETHRTTLEAEFRERPPHTIAEAAERIEKLTGVRRKETQVRMFLKKVSA